MSIPRYVDVLAQLHDIKSKTRYLLDQIPDAKNRDDNLLVLSFWKMFDVLDVNIDFFLNKRQQALSKLTTIIRSRRILAVENPEKYESIIPKILHVKRFTETAYQEFVAGNS